MGRILAVLIVIIALLYIFKSYRPHHASVDIRSQENSSPLTPVPLGKERLSAGDGEVTWTDPAGDVLPFSNMAIPRPDVVSAKAGSADGYLVLTAQFKDDPSGIAEWTDEEGCHHGCKLVEFLIDADNNPETGGEPHWAHEADRPLKGYEASTDILLGYLARSKGSTNDFKPMTGDLKFDPEKWDLDRPAIRGVAWTMGGALKEEFSAGYFPWYDRSQEMCLMEKDTCQVRVPYTLLNVSPGATVRLCFKESAQGTASGKGFSEDKLLVLR